MLNKWNDLCTKAGSDIMNVCDLRPLLSVTNLLFAELKVHMLLASYGFFAVTDHEHTCTIAFLNVDMCGQLNFIVISLFSIFIETTAGSPCNFLEYMKCM